jgi:hypothetical protein
MKASAMTMLLASLGLGAAMLVPGAASADEDFGRYTNEELVQMRTRAGEMSDAERTQYRAEMQKRVQAMSPEERARLGVGPGGEGAPGQRTRSAEDNTQGQGSLERERARTEAESQAGFGQGYEQRDRERTRASEDNAEGQGELQRKRERLEDRGYDRSSYGRGYESRRGGGRQGGGGRGGRI